MNIRQATIDDARTIALLNQHVQQVHADQKSELYKQAELSDDLVMFYADRLQADNEVIYIAEDDAVAVGYVHTIVRERPENPFVHIRRDVVINAISVNPDYYGTGVADKLTQVVVDLAQEQGIKRIVLDVWDWNTRARRFYEKQGFTTFIHRMEMMLE